MTQDIKKTKRRYAGRSTPRLLCGVSLSALAMLGLPLAVHAEDRYWDANGSNVGAGGTGNWNTSSLFWSETSSDVLGPYWTWNNVALDHAIFGGTAGTVTLTSPITVGNITFNAANYTLTGGTLTLGGINPAIAVNAGTSTINSALAGNSGLIKTGAGTLFLTGNNTFSGGINLNAGSLRASNDAALGALSNTILVTGNTGLRVDAGDLSNRTVTVGAGSTLTLSGAAPGTALYTGAGNLSITTGVTMNNDASTYTGTTRLNGANAGSGNVFFTSVRNLGEASSLGAPVTEEEGTITFAGGSQYTDRVTYIGTGDSSNRNWVMSSSNTARRFVNAGTGTLTITGDISVTANGGARFEAINADIALLGVISGGSNVHFFSDASTKVTLGGANTFSGLTSISGGVVEASVLADSGESSSFGTGAGIDIGHGGVLSYIGTGDSSDRTWSGNGAIGIRNDGTGALTLTGDLSFNPATPNPDSLTLGGTFAGTNIFSGEISGAADLLSTGSSVWELSGANTRTGAIIVNGGTLRAGGASAFGSVTGVTVNGGVLDLNGFNMEASSLNGTGGEIGLGAGTLTIDNTLANSFAGAITGTGGLIKSGAGALTLSGANSYTGDTTIGGGALNLNFSAASAPASNILSASSTLNMAGGVLNLTGADGAANTQDFDGLIVVVGNNRINATSGTGGSMTVNLGAVSRTGGLIDFDLPDNGVFTTTNADGAIGGWAMVNSTDYAKVLGGEIVAFDDTDYTDKDDASTWADGEFISDAEGAADTPFFSAVGGNVQLGGLRYTAAAASTVTIGGGDTLGVDGAIIVAPSVGAQNQLITGGSLTGSSGGGTLGVLQNSAGNFTIASSIINNGGATGFTKGGAGQVTLTGANTYTGATTLSDGTLSVSDIGDGGDASNIGASSAASSNLVLQAGTLRYTGGTATTDRGFMLVNGGASRTIQIDGAANLTFTGLVTSPDDAGFTKTGTGVLTLANGGNDYIGATAITGGVLSIDTIADGGSVSGIGASANDSANLVMSGGGRLQYTGGSASSDRGFTLNAGGGGFDVSGPATELTLSGAGVGTGGLIKDGAGALVLSGVNIYTGGTVVNDGILRAGSTQAFGAVTALMTVNSGGVLDLDGFNNRLGALAGDGIVTLGSATLTSGGNINGTFTGAITGTGGFTKTGSGVQTLTGCNSDYTGVTTINGGTLSVNCLADGGVASGVGASGSASANLTLIGGRLTYTGASVGIDRGVNAQSGHNYINVTGGGTTLEIGGGIVGGGNLRKEGAGVLLLSGNNSYAGHTYVDAGTLRAGSSDAFGAASLQMSNVAGGMLDLNGFNNAFTFLHGGGAAGGNITLGGATLTITAGNNTSNYAGVISGVGGLIKNGAANSLQTITGCNNSYTGSTVINGGILAVNCLDDGGANSTIGASNGDAANLVLNGGTLRYVGAGNSTDRQFTLGPATTSALDASGTGVVNFTSAAAISFASPGANQTLTLTGTNTGNNTFAAQITNNVAGQTSLTKTGTGTWMLTNPGSTHTGITTITGGVLGVDKLSDGGIASSIGMSSNAAGNLIIGTGGTLRYTGTGDVTDRRFTLATGTTAIQSSGAGAIEFTNTGAISYSGNGVRVVSLGGTNTDDNIMGASIGNQSAANITSLAKNDAGRWILTGDNNYTGSTNINAGILILGNGGTTGSVVSGTINNFGLLGFNRSDEYSFGGIIQGSGGVEQLGAGVTILTGDNTYTGATNINAGSLWINGDQSAATGLTTVASGARLGGVGTIGGDVSIANGGILAPGNSPGVLTINGDLILDSGSVLDFEFGQANVVGGPLNDLIEVGGDLTLDGVIDVTVSAGGSFDAGLYRIINYAGTLTDNGLDIGSMPPGSDAFIQTSIANQVNLVNTAGLDVNFWDGDAGPKFDGTVNGGSGLWQNGGGNDNWVDISGLINLPWIDDAFAIFTATAGTVTVDDSLGAVTALGLQFASDGYLITGDSVGLVGPQSILRVGDGTAAGASMTAVIASELTGATEIVKTDLGRLVLSGANTFTGGARIEAGILSVSSDANLGDAAGGVALNGGALQSTATFASARSVTLEGAGTFLTDGGTTLTLDGLVSGAGGLEKAGGGALVLTSDNTYSGGTTITDGELQLGDGGASGSILGNVVNDGVFSFNRSDALTFGGMISGAGAFSQIGAGTTILTGDNSYTGGTTISAGVLQLGDGGVTGSILGDVNNNAALAFNRLDDLTFAGLISGIGALNQIGGGTTFLTADNSYAGATNVDFGTLIVNGDQTAATGLTSVATGATLGGDGVIGGDVTVADGGVLAPGSNDVGTLTINGALSLNDTSLLAYEFGQSDVIGGPLNDLIEVGGDLTLDGVIDVTVSPGGSFDVGLYRVISYGGTLTDNTLELGAMPPGSDVFVQTSIASQVNLVNTAGLALNFWDGATGPKFDNAVNGGDGIWQASGDDNWTDLAGALNAAYQDSAFAIFSAAPGTVTVEDTLGAVNAVGMQFSSDGYVLTGDAVGLVGAQSIIRVGDGTSAGRDMMATIESALFGAGDLLKTDIGTLVLTGASDITGEVNVMSGALRIADGGALNSASALIGTDAGYQAITTVTGADGEGNASIWAIGADLMVGYSGAGTLNIADGGKVISGSGIIGIDTGGIGQVLVTGAGSSWETPGRITAGLFGDGFLTIEDGATVSSQDGVVGGSGAGSIVVSGPGASWTNAGQLTIGSFGAGDMRIEDGASVFSNQGYIGANATGSVTVTGAGSEWVVTDFSMTVGNVGAGALTVENGARVRAEGGFSLGIAAGSSGDIALLGTAGNHGILETSQIRGGGGEVNFTMDGGLLRATRDVGEFFVNFDAHDLILGGNGGVIDTNGHTIGIAPRFVGTGGLTKDGSGILRLTGANSYAGATLVNAGVLVINGDQSAATGPTTVSSGATLGGNGVIGGDVDLLDGSILTPGENVGALTINGNLSVASGAILNYDLGQANTAGGVFNDLVNVGGDLVLDGTLNVAVPAGGSFGAGLYRLFNYGGVLTNNGLDLGVMPSDSMVLVQTAVAGQVNLINGQGVALNFWDGAAGPKFDGVINGGDGLWQSMSGNDNWTDEDGVFNASYADGAFAIFSGAAGTVTVDNSLGEVTASGMQFATDGYVIDGDPILLTGPQATLRVGDGTAMGEAMTATIDAELEGATQLVKTDLGTLVLTGANSYTGGTVIEDGLLQISSDANLGAASGALTFDGGALRTTADVNSNRDVIFTSDGVFLTDADTTFTTGGSLSGAGGFTKNGAGTLVLTGDSSGYAGGARIAGGILAINGGLGGAIDVMSGGRLEGVGVAGDIVNQTGGVVAPGFGGIGQLTVASYTGAGGILEIETELGGDASPADRLIVTGDTSGATIVSVINRGGFGDQTVEGIKIIEVGGVSNGAFTLDGDYLFEGEQAVVAGAFGYRLYKNGLADPNDGDWYLRSALLNPEDPDEETPLYQPGVPLYEVYPQMLSALIEAPTLHQRVGTRAWRNGMWGRVEGSHDRIRPETVTRTRHDADRWHLEAGVDAAFLNATDGTLVAGLVANYAQSDANVSSVFGGGEIETSAWGVGATLTWYGENGFYLDFQGRAHWFDSELASDTAGWEIDNDGRGRALSVELGHRAGIGGGFALTPQMQLVHSHVDFDTFEDPFGAVVRRDQGSSFRGRFGLALDHNSAWTGASGAEHDLRGYAIANVHYEFLDEMRVSVTGTGFSTGEEPLWGSLGLGGEYGWNKRISLFGEASAETTLNGFGDSQRLTARIGVRAAF